MYVSSSFVPKMTSSTTVTAEASSAARSAHQNESTWIALGAMCEATQSITASSTSTSTKPAIERERQPQRRDDRRQHRVQQRDQRGGDDRAAEALDADVRDDRSRDQQRRRRRRTRTRPGATAGSAGAPASRSAVRRIALRGCPSARCGSATLEHFDGRRRPGRVRSSVSDAPGASTRMSTAGASSAARRSELLCGRSRVGLADAPAGDERVRPPVDRNGRPRLEQSQRFGGAARRRDGRGQAGPPARDRQQCEIERARAPPSRGTDPCRRRSRCVSIP